MTAPVLERCDSCRKVCTCPRIFCGCMTWRVEGDVTELLCHRCTDAREVIDGGA